MALVHGAPQTVRNALTPAMLTARASNINSIQIAAQPVRTQSDPLLLKINGNARVPMI